MPLTRRKFLKLLGLGGASTLTGCSDYSPTRLIPYLYPPEDIIPGKALWYASTCRECPAGCGLLAKNRDGRVIKVEGNPVHPVSDGKLCPRGQASLQGLYNPDRFPGPMMKNRNGRFDPITWEKGETILARSLEALVQKKRGEKIVFVSELINGSLKELIDLFLSEMKGSELLFYEPLSYEDLRKANQAVFQLDGLPHYRIDRADFLISLGAGFLETWLSNLEFARQFALFHSLKEKGKNPFIYVGPRLSMTANNADQWIGVPPGDEYLIALGLLQILLADGQQVDFPGELKTVALQALQGFSLDRISQKTRVPVDVIKDLARRFDQSERPLVLAEGLGLSGTRSYEAAVAANLLCLLKPGSRKLMDFKSQLSLGQAASLDRMQNLTERMKKKEVDLLFLGQVNPVFTLPFSSDFQEGLSTVPLVVSFSSYPDETCRHAHLILPNHTFLESWGDYSPRSGVLNLMQPVMGPVFQTRHTGDVLMAAGRKISSPETFPWKDFYAFLKNSWSQKVNEWGPGLSSEEFWQRAMEKGGVWKKPGEAELKFTLKTRSLSFPPIEPASATDQRLDLTVYPTVQFFDGRQANRPWIQELPDPLTQVTWDGWLEIHPETALARG
ncbi:MAG TPA: molybdopterin-dependent oxidoreductase, partial [Thermodesulfobacteriota bacterium]|nr:molybdopterin-dependent oxidoreductase [Thermodesulfobacteriota bacterium]